MRNVRLRIATPTLIAAAFSMAFAAVGCSGSQTPEGSAIEDRPVAESTEETLPPDEQGEAAATAFDCSEVCTIDLYNTRVPEEYEVEPGTPRCECEAERVRELVIERGESPTDTIAFSYTPEAGALTAMTWMVKLEGVDEPEKTTFNYDAEGRLTGVEVEGDTPMVCRAEPPCAPDDAECNLVCE